MTRKPPAYRLRRGCVFPSRHEEHVGAGRPDAVRLLLDAPDRADACRRARSPRSPRLGSPRSTSFRAPGRPAARTGAPRTGRRRRRGRCSTSSGSSILASCETLMPMIARFSSSGAATVLTVRSSCFPSRRSRRLTSSPGMTRPTALPELRDGEHRASATSTITSPLSQRVRGGHVDRHRLDEDAARRRPRRRGRPPGARPRPRPAPSGSSPRAPRRSARRTSRPGAVTACAGTSEAPSGRRNGTIRSSQRTFRTVTST